MYSRSSRLGAPRDKGHTVIEANSQPSRSLAGRAAGPSHVPSQVAWWWIAPSVTPSRSPRPPHWRAMISAAMLTAVSSGVRAPRSRPIGEESRASSSSLDPRLAEPLEPVLVGAPRPHGADVGDLGQPQRLPQHRHVELGVVGEHADHRPAVEPPRLGLGGEIAVRPLDDDLLGRREPPRVAKTGRASHTVTAYPRKRPMWATAAAKSMAPKTSIRGRGA